MTSIILDASAIINGLEFPYLDVKFITTDSILEEIQSESAHKELVLALDLDKITISVPKDKYLSIIEKEIKQTSDKLSVQDIGILALALELSSNLENTVSDKIIIATDDFGIQNIAKKLGLNFISVNEKEIKKVIKWKYYCPACYKNYSKEQKECPICGSKIKRKPKTKN